MKARLKIDGISALLRDLEKVGRAGDDVAASAVEGVAEGTARIARARIGSGSGSSAPGGYPKGKSGRLERSITVILKKAKRTTAIVGTARLQGRFLELGTGKMEPRPWLLPSFEDARDTETGNLAAEFEGKL